MLENRKRTDSASVCAGTEKPTASYLIAVIDPPGIQTASSFFERDKDKGGTHSSQNSARKELRSTTCAS